MSSYSSLDCDDETTVHVTSHFPSTTHQSIHRPLPDFTCFNKSIQSPQSQYTPISHTSSHTVHLNVGGTMHTTSWSTLLRHDNTYFTALHSSNSYYADNTSNNNNTIFIDRDGTIFNYILNYLRDNNLQFIQHCKSIELLMRLHTESNYYLLTDLCNIIQQRIDILIELEYTQATQQQSMHEQLHSVVSTALNTPSKSNYSSRCNSDCTRITMNDCNGTPCRSNSSTAFRSLNFDNNNYNDVPLAISQDWQFTTNSDF